MATGIDWIGLERRRQKSTKGYDAAHDATHDKGELVFAAIVYLTRAACEAAGIELDLDLLWPWDKSEMNTRAGGTRLLIIAGALIAAELDRRLEASAVKFADAMSGPKEEG